MDQYLYAERYVSPWVYDVDPDLDVLYVTDKGEVALQPSGSSRLVVPVVPYERNHCVLTAAAERLFARGAMMGAPVRAAGLHEHFARMGLTYRILARLAGEELALPLPEAVGVVIRGSWSYGMFLYPSRVVRVVG